MGVAAATTAGSAYLLGEVINQAYVDKNVRGIFLLSLVTIVIFTLKGAATYGHSVILSQISNAILANNQRRLFAKLMSESIGFFSQRHSSEFLARLTAGATSVTQVLTLLINAVGRDLLSLIALVVVMVMQDPYMALFGFLVAWNEFVIALTITRTPAAQTMPWLLAQFILAGGRVAYEGGKTPSRPGRVR